MAKDPWRDIWSVSDEQLEEVECFRCQRKGKLDFACGRFGIVRCECCGQAFVSPRLKAGERARIYDDERYFRLGLYGNPIGRIVKRIWTQGRLELLRRLLNRTAVQPRLLEVGCAYGGFLFAAERAGFSVTGVEYSRAAVDWLRSHSRFPVYQGTVDQFPLPGERFDCVCLYDVIEHVARPDHVMRSVFTLLAPGGIVSLSCPDFASLMARLFRAHWRSLRPQEHIWQFTVESLGRLLVEAGFVQIQIERSPLLRANLFRTDMLLGWARKPG